MAYEHPGAGSLDYAPCRYGNSRLLFRGPPRPATGRYCAILGGSEVYGKYVRDPYPLLVERAIGRPVLNLGAMNAGLDVFLNDPGVLDIVAGAELTIVQLVGAHNMSNRFYAVHPRRNDRFLRASQTLKALFRDVDFTEFHFTRHLLLTLRHVSPERYSMVEQELKVAWTARMRLLLQKIPGRCLLLWAGDPHPGGRGRDALGPAPLLIDDEMVASIRSGATDFLRFAPSPAAQRAGPEGMVFAPLESPAAAELPGPRIHEELAAALVPAIRKLLTQEKGPAGSGP